MDLSPFEALMILCFGAAWPVSIYKSYTSRKNGGKSVHFLYVILLGYLSGIVHKVLYNPDPVVVLYALNGAMVAVDIGVYYRNERLAQRNCGI